MIVSAVGTTGSLKTCNSRSNSRAITRDQLMDSSDRKHAECWRRSNPTLAWRFLRLSKPQQQCAARLLSFPADNSATIGSNGVSLRFWADMHPEKDVATLNKCKPQKV